MSVIFADVTDITIPEGEVIKIHETSTGRILWEKKHINISVEQFSCGSERWYTCVENGSNIMFFAQSIYSPSKYFTYNPINNTCSAISQTKSVGVEYGIDIDPSSKTWLVTGSGRGADYYSSGSINDEVNIENSSGRTIAPKSKFFSDGYSQDTQDYTSFTPSKCCWLISSRRFCVVGGWNSGSSTKRFYSFLVGTDGLIYNWQKNEIGATTMGLSPNQYKMCYSSELNRVLLVLDDGCVYISSNGLSWNKATNTFNSTYSASNTTFFTPSNKNFFIASLPGGAIYKSTTGYTWTQISTISGGLDLGAWSPSKQLFLGLKSSGTAYLTKDFVTWDRVSFGKTVSPYGKLIWSETANAFICAPYVEEGIFYKIKVD